MKRGKKIIVAVSGGFSVLHPGHIRLFRGAKALGDELVVILNNDNWMKKKYGHLVLTENERKELIEAIGTVDRVVLTKHEKDPEDMSVCHMLLEIRPNIFANGGDRNEKDAQNINSSLNQEKLFCKEHGIDLVFGVGHGGKIQSSSWLLKKIRKDSV